jgi:hypothetical protein
MDTFPLLQPIEIKLVMTKASVKIENLILGQSALLCVRLLGDDGIVLQTRVMTLSGDDYLKWGDNDNYIIQYVQRVLAQS